jgi:hypothetical protein
MKGVLFNIVEDVVSEHLGDAVWDQLLEDAGVDRGYTALGNYPDAEMTALIKAAAQTLDKPPRHVMVWIGQRATVHFFKRAPHYLKPHDSARTFLPRLDQIIHPEVRKLYDNAHPPDFVCTDHGGAAGMTVIYRSHRRLCGLAEGLIQGVADYYQERLVIEHPECIENRGARCRFELRFA